jgi:hypothetical protein
MVELLQKTLRNLSKKVVLKLNQPKILKQLHLNQLKKIKKQQLVQVVMTNNKYHNYEQ